MNIYIYIYIHMCVSVCVDARMSWRLSSKLSFSASQVKTLNDVVWVSLWSNASWKGMNSLIFGRATGLWEGIKTLNSKYTLLNISSVNCLFKKSVDDLRQNIHCYKKNHLLNSFGLLQLTVCFIHMALCHIQAKGFVNYLQLRHRFWWLNSASLWVSLRVCVFPISKMVSSVRQWFRDRGSIPGRIILKTQKMILDASLFNTLHNKVRIYPG